ncbi:flagellar biosynthesis protein FlgA [Massilia violaceinigra]|uniref:Flagella basal body P-ring formation protein FlgA n=1 Tax=Massilia violaceinigra TaxID=2045208 RepID=A0A2D2DV90_9BURK|nr:flagellar basal body P-ring formation chaperone FlgA [Massilia violaceinigra]ATQ78898.1 flagellar biosynthesis protein FlgA [Massilia violaceinigra]
MKIALITAFLLASQCCFVPPAAAQAAATPALALQDPAALKRVAEAFLQAQSAALAGEVTVTVGPINQRMSLASCPAPQAFQQPGARTWGKTTVGVRCTAPVAWKVYIQAQVSVVTDYVATAVPLAQGQTIEQSQLVLLRGDISAMPNGIVTDMGQAVGRTSTVSLASGAPLRLDALRGKQVVQQGQLVRVVSTGNGFRVSAEARAIGNASDGQVVQVRTPAGAILSGVAKAGGLVEVVF